MNRRLAWMPRFHARMPWDRMLVQSMLHVTQTVMTTGHGGVEIENRDVECRGERVRLRILRPDGPCRGVYLDYHGGGWAVGNARMDDPVNARIASDCGLSVVSVDYGLAPQLSVPEIISQCTAAADWVLDHAEAEFGAGGIVIGGESAGAHLAACVLLRLRETRGDFARVRGAVLFYGAFDLAGTQSARSADRDTLVLHGPTLRAGLEKLTPGLTDEERRDPGLSPLYADLRGLPPALVIVGTLDPLFDDSETLAERWRAASGNAELLVVPEAPHAFNRLGTSMGHRTNAYARRWAAERLAAASPASAVA